MSTKSKSAVVVKSSLESKQGAALTVKRLQLTPWGTEMITSTSATQITAGKKLSPSERAPVDRVKSAA